MNKRDKNLFLKVTVYSTYIVNSNEISIYGTLDRG